jgi:hypothetical protein
MRRGLSLAFMDALKKDGRLGINRFLQATQRDQTLCLEIRDNNINIYYRGGNLLKLEERKGEFTAIFDRNYILDPIKSRVPLIVEHQRIKSADEVAVWIDAIPHMKQEMDWWFCGHPKDEREFQQLMVRENNFGSTAKGTDYYICDIEYASANGRFDLIAVHWPSTSSHRKDNTNVGLAFIEMKYMDKSMVNTSGICDHILAMERYFGNNPDNFAALKLEMKIVFNQKMELELINNQKKIESFNDEKPDFIIALANHDPASTILRNVLTDVSKMSETLPFQVKFSVANYMGYGLYDQNILGLEEFISRNLHHI